MKNAAILLALSSLALGGCGLTLPVKGQVTGSSEVFTGSATGYADGAGSMKITSNRGATCSGPFVYETRRKGSGTFTCSDGRAGTYTFSSTGTKGSGTGTVGKRQFIFTFGNA